MTRSFNTQPPEGGCKNAVSGVVDTTSFNTQPPEGGCTMFRLLKDLTHYCFNTQPPEGGCQSSLACHKQVRSFNTQPPEGGCQSLLSAALTVWQFQHTATRRWLPAKPTKYALPVSAVSTHSHPKVAAVNILKKSKHGLKFQHTATRRWLLKGRMKNLNN